MTVAKFTQPDYTTQSDSSEYPVNIDGAIRVLSEIGADFAPHEQDTPDMTVRVDAGSILNGTTYTEVAAQNTGTITAPSSNDRIDRVVVDQDTGTVSVIAGSEAASPVAPSITSGKLPVCSVALTPGQTSIVNADISDERVGFHANNINISGLTDTVITASDEIVFADADDSGALKKDTVQGILDLVSGTSDADRANISLNAFRIAVNGGLSVQNMVDGIVDEFEDETGVDTGSSSNQTYNSSDDYYVNTGTQTQISQGSGSAFGNMTSNGGLAALFDSVTSQTVAASAVGAMPAYAGKDWGSGVTRRITGVRTYAPSDGPYYNGSGNITFSVYGSNSSPASGTDGTLLGTFDASDSTSDITFKSSGLTETTAYRYHWIYNNKGSGVGSLRVAELEFFETPPVDMTLISNTFTALSQPDEVFLVLWTQDIDTVTLNTDLLAYASRDGGTTWTLGTLSLEASLTTGQILTATIDVSSQPSGTSMEWRIITANNKEVRIHGVSEMWS